MTNEIKLDGQLMRIPTWQIDECGIRARFDLQGFLEMDVVVVDEVNGVVSLRLDHINSEKLCTWLRCRLDEKKSVWHMTDTDVDEALEPYKESRNQHD